MYKKYLFSLINKLYKIHEIFSWTDISSSHSAKNVNVYLKSEKKKKNYFIDKSNYALNVFQAKWIENFCELFKNDYKKETKIS